MKVFISWSGILSQKIAEVLKSWLEQCIQSIEAFYSTEDIEKGETWNAKLTSELSDTNFGIVCLTKDNINAPWIHFEAGALSKMLDSRVATLAIDVKFADIKGPLSIFQATKLEKDDMYKLLKDINSAQEKSLTEEKLKVTFEAFWDSFESKIKEILSTVIEKEEKKTNAKNSVADSVEEILQLVRSQNAIIKNPTNIIPPDYLEEVVRKITHRRDVNNVMDSLFDFTRYLLDRFSVVDRVENEELQFFIYEYCHYIETLVSDYPIWRRRFNLLFSQNKKIPHKVFNE